MRNKCRTFWVALCKRLWDVVKMSSKLCPPSIRVVPLTVIMITSSPNYVRHPQPKERVNLIFTPFIYNIYTNIRSHQRIEFDVGETFVYASKYIFFPVHSTNSHDRAQPVLQNKYGGSFLSFANTNSNIS